MTAVAALVAEAIASAREATSVLVRNHPRTTWLSGDVEGMTVLDPVRYHRDDVVDAALAHLVARVVGAEGRAKTAEARAIEAIVEVLDIVNRHDHCADARRAIEAIVCPACDAWRALLARDIADVERYILDCQSFFTPTWQGSWERAHIADCRAWLVRARAALGGDR